MPCLARVRATTSTTSCLKFHFFTLFPVCANLNFLALSSEVRKHAEKALKAFSGSDSLVFNDVISDAIAELRERNELYCVELDDKENDVYFLADDEVWHDIFKNSYVAEFVRGYAKANQILASLKGSPDQQNFTAFSGVYRVDERLNLPVTEMEEKQVLLPSVMGTFGFETGKYIAYWDFIFSNPMPFEQLFLQKSAQSPIAKGIQFHGTKMDFVELMVALKENGNLKATHKEIFDICGKFFGVEIKYRDKYISDLKNNRNAGQESKLLNQLVTALNNRVGK